MQRSALCRSRRELSNAYLLAKLASIQPRTSPLKFAASESEPRSLDAHRRFAQKCIPETVPASVTELITTDDLNIEPKFVKDSSEIILASVEVLVAFPIAAHYFNVLVLITRLTNETLYAVGIDRVDRAQGDQAETLFHDVSR